MKKYYVQIKSHYDFWVEVETTDVEDAIKYAEAEFIENAEFDIVFGELDSWEVVDCGLVK